MPDPDSRSFVDSEDLLHNEARARTGLSDFGDKTYLTPLRFLLGTLDREAKLSTAGRRRIAEQIVTQLVSRLYSEKGWADHPACLKGQIRKPLLITGLPRTGTSALHKLMNVDPQFQGLELWLIDNPMVRPPRETWDRFPEFRKSVEKVRRMYEAAPDMMAAHEMAADEVYECLMLVQQSFIGLGLSTFADIRGYDRWLLTQDETASYQRYADNLRLIGYGNDKTWLLKNPATIYGIEGFLNAFPDACIVQTHRHPLESVPSGAHLIHLARQGSEGAATDPRAAGEREVFVWSEAMKKGMASHDKHPDRFHDVKFHDFNKDPIGVARGIYYRFGYTLSPITEAAMKRWVDANPKGKRGEHIYSLEEVGLSEAKINDRFGDYIGRFEL